MIDKKTVWAFLKPFVLHTIKQTILRQAAYEPNNKFTWERVGTSVMEFVQGLVVLENLYDVKVVCDDTVNTDETIKANEFHLNFSWKGLKEDEWSTTQFTLTPKEIKVESEEDSV